MTECGVPHNLLYLMFEFQAVNPRKIEFLLDKRQK